MKDLTTYRRDNDMTCALCNNTACTTPLTDSDLENFLTDMAEHEAQDNSHYECDDCWRCNPCAWNAPPTADHTDPLYQG